MPSNKGVAYIKPGQVEIRTTEYPTFELLTRALGDDEGTIGPIGGAHRSPAPDHLTTPRNPPLSITLPRHLGFVAVPPAAPAGS